MEGRSLRSNNNLASDHWPPGSPERITRRRRSTSRLSRETMPDNNNGAPAQPAPGNDGAQPPPPQNDGGPVPAPPGGPAQQPEAPAPPPEAPPPPPPAPAPQPNSRWCANPMAGNFDPGTPHGREIFKNKTRGLPDDQKFALTTKDAPEI